MNMEQLRRMLYDMYGMDAKPPPLFGKWSEEFKKESYKQWAIKETLHWIEDVLSPRDTGTIEELYSITKAFCKKLERYEKVNPRAESLFYYAKKGAIDILDVLNAMR